MQTNNLQAQKGFTLVEIAIVLVIIGLLLGGVLKGQELINSAKIKADTDTLVSLQAAAYAYEDRIGELPGEVVANPNQIPISDSNNVVAGGFFDDLQTQGFLSDANLMSEFIPVAFFAAGFSAAPAAATGMAIAGRNQVCLFTEALLATGIDNKLDDGDGATGTVRTIALGAAVGDADTSVCLEI